MALPARNTAAEAFQNRKQNGFRVYVARAIRIHGTIISIAYTYTIWGSIETMARRLRQFSFN